MVAPPGPGDPAPVLAYRNHLDRLHVRALATISAGNALRRKSLIQ